MTLQLAKIYISCYPIEIIKEDNHLKNNAILIGIVLLLFISTTPQIVFGFNGGFTKQNQELENYIFNSFNEYDSTIAFYEENYPQNYKIYDVERYETIPLDTLSTNTHDPMDSPWPMKCHDNRHTSQSSYSTADNPGVEKWRFKCDPVEGGVVLDAEGNIYFGDFLNYLYCLYPNGFLKWKYHINALIWSTPAIGEDGTIYIGSYDSHLHAINPNGTRKWTFYASDAISSSPAIDDDGTIYFGAMGPGSDAGRIFAVNPNGTERWHYDTGYWIASDPAIADDGTIYIGSGDSYLYALYPNGTLRWRFKTGDIVKSHPSIAEDGTIYFASFDHKLYALYPNGNLRWSRSSGYSGCSSVAIGNDGILYFGGNPFYAAYPENGTTIWSLNLGSDRYIDKSSPAISADGTIYVGTNIGSLAGGEIIAINPDGSEHWRKMIANDFVDSSPCIGADGTIYIGSVDNDAGYPLGYLHAFGKIESNSPPSEPEIAGQTWGKTGNKLQLTFLVEDPDNNPVRFYIDWGDGSPLEWTQEYASGEIATIEHVWAKEGTYEIKAKAKDVLDEESDWSESFELRAVDAHTAFLCGKLYDYEYIDYLDEITFKAQNILIIQLSPLLIKKCSSGEQIYVVDKTGLLLTGNYAFGFFPIYYYDL